MGQSTEATRTRFRPEIYTEVHRHVQVVGYEAMDATMLCTPNAEDF